jgi:V8-like Glu-specific endopeptidase
MVGIRVYAIYFKYDIISDDDLVKSEFNIAGYLINKDMGTLYGQSRQIESLLKNKDFIYYFIDTLGGQRGSPIWYKRNGEEYVTVGIYFDGNLTRNAGGENHSTVYEDIRKWSEEGT